MNIVLNKINQILMEKYLKLQDTCRTQVRRDQSPPPAASLAEDEQRTLELGGAWGQAPLLHVVEGKLGWWRLPRGHPGCCGEVSWEGLAGPVLTSPPHPAGVAAAGAGEERRARRGRCLHDLHEADRRWVPCCRQQDLSCSCQQAGHAAGRVVESDPEPRLLHGQVPTGSARRRTQGRQEQSSLAGAQPAPTCLVRKSLQEGWGRGQTLTSLLLPTASTRSESESEPGGFWQMLEQEPN